MPSLADLHLDQYLSELSVQYKNADYVAVKLFPVVPVGKEHDKFVKYTQEMLFNVFEDRRADGAVANEIDWSLGAPGYYHCEEHAERDLVTDRQQREADKPMTVAVDTTEFVNNAIDLKREYASAQIARTAGNYAAGNVLAQPAANAWNNYTSTTSHPYADIKTAQKAIYKQIRKMPNRIILAQSVALDLGQHPDTIDRVKYTHPDLLTNEGLPTRILGMEVVTAGAGYNSAAYGQAANLADIWGADVIMAYVEDAPKIKSLSFGKTFRTKKYAKVYRDEPRGGDWVEASDIYDVQVYVGGCGYLIQNATQ